MDSSSTLDISTKIMNFKRRRPKNGRSGCLMCKSHKANGVTKTMHIRGRKGKIKVTDLDREEREI